MLTVLRRTQREFWSSELRVATGRSAVYHLMKVAKPRLVLMPCYVPDGIILPIEAADIPVKFYRLSQGLTPDFEDLKENMCAGACVVVVHYFGYKSPTKYIRELVDAHNGLLFEDCGHALYGPASVASNADVALWSLNKFLPITDGAILKSRRRDVDVNYTGFKQVFDVRAVKYYHRHLDLNAEFAETGDQKLLERSNLFYEKYYQIIRDDYRLCEQTAESKLLEAQIKTDNDFTERAASAEIISLILPALKSRPEYPVFGFPVLVKDPDDRPKVIKRLHAIGIHATALTDKWNHIPRGSKKFPIESDFLARHLLLPLPLTRAKAFEAERCFHA
jgi:hypothetical protein